MQFYYKCIVKMTFVHKLMARYCTCNTACTGTHESSHDPMRPNF
jgi:hypothetical protein